MLHRDDAWRRAGEADRSGVRPHRIETGLRGRVAVHAAIMASCAATTEANGTDARE
jgi:hypothetical protein